MHILLVRNKLFLNLYNISIKIIMYIIKEVWAKKE